MDINSITASAPGVSQASTGDAASMLVLKKSLDAQSNSALGLIEAIPKPPNSPPHLGNRIDTTA